MAENALDALDRAILHALEEDGRRALREIARSVGSSEATVRSRVKRMQEAKILRIVAFADPERLGGAQLSLAFLTVEPALHDRVVESLSELSEITYLSTVMGRSDLCVEVSTKDNAELWSFLKDKVRTIEGVRHIETMPVLKVHKLRYRSPLPSDD
jgi:Lrp/AsnC family transcriptional regulator for asnA, asnC and gidA